MSRKVTSEVRAKIGQWEGLVLYAYDDFDTSSPRKFIEPGMPVRGTLTIGYGHTGTVKPGMRITEAEADHLLSQDLAWAEAAVDRLVKVPLSDNQFGALVSFCFNVGETNFASSTLLRRLNAGEYDAVPHELAKWVYSKKVRMQGLVNRRAAEAGLWASGEFVSSAPVDANRAPLPSPQDIIKSPEGLTGIAGALAAIFSAIANQPILQIAAVLVIGFLLWRFFIAKRDADPA